jgi:hypothetical protein
MLIKQISVFVENKFGRLAKITEVLSENNVDIEALSLADTTDFGVMRLIVDKPEVAISALKEHGVIAKITEVISIELEHTPGGLTKVLNKLSENEIAIEYMYAFVGGKTDGAQLVIKTDDIEKTQKILG